MRVARWKVMAGGLLLSAGGLMAVADGPAPLPGCQPAPVCLPALPAPAGPAITRVSLEAPIAVPAPNVAELPIPAQSLPPLPKPEDARPSKRASAFPNPDPSGAVLKPNSLPVKGKAFVIRRPDGSQEVLEPKVTPAPFDQIPLDAYPPAKPGVKVEDAKLPAAPAPALPPTLTTPVIETKPAKSEPATLTLPSPLPAPAPRPEPFINTIGPAEPATPAPAVPTEKPLPASEPKKPEPVPSAAEKRLKVVLHMGDDRPRFEVRDGDEIYLKVVSDRVEVKSAADKGDAPTMKAGGKVAFVTPGGDGTCDELTILPGSGQVVAAGNVAFRHTWGRSETTVTAERMTFRLAHPGPTAIQAGYTPVR